MRKSTYLRGVSTAALDIADAARSHAETLAECNDEALLEGIQFGVKWEDGRAVGEHGDCPAGTLFSQGVVEFHGELLTYARALVMSRRELAGALIETVNDLAEADREDA
ncbi:hypothetical protein [Rhodovulum euryhalinum]|uniref:Uncharacterized protein n=1 Tax=Rhodovulum euryhalinum TaxID=35805 RepID=A0A4R2K9X6_9RHOB|nr:hypothetical protein [Rhodovulum euryhalinum]TCO70251.1 hypothetical protein EV655_11015 [Rhodovulum euryhalinum]